MAQSNSDASTPLPQDHKPKMVFMDIQSLPRASAWQWLEGMIPKALHKAGAGYGNDRLLPAATCRSNSNSPFLSTSPACLPKQHQSNQLSSPQWMLAIFARHEGAPEGRNTEHKSFTHFIQGNSQHMKSVMTNLHCPPDHIWNQLKPRQLGIFLKDCID